MKWGMLSEQVKKNSGSCKESITDPVTEYALFCLFRGVRITVMARHNPQTHDFNGGTIVDSGQVLEEFKSKPFAERNNFFRRRAVLSGRGVG